MNIDKLVWYVKLYDFNRKQLYNYNIFNNIHFREGTQEALKIFKTNCDKDVFKEEIKNQLMYAFWSKREYELFIGDAFETDINNYEKVDVYSQVLPNLDILVDYIIEKIFVEIY